MKADTHTLAYESAQCGCSETALIFDGMFGGMAAANIPRWDAKGCQACSLQWAQILLSALVN